MKVKRMVSVVLVFILVISCLIISTDSKSFGSNNNNPRGETIDIKVTKEWQPPWAVDLIRQYRDPNFANSCTIKLIANGQDTGEQITLNDSNATGYWVWESEFKDVDKYDANGDLINYSVEELETPTSYFYVSDVTGSPEDGFVITNYINEGYYMVESPLSIYKAWEDNNNEDGIRPDHITLHITYYPGANHSFGDDPLVLSANNGWGHTVYISEQIGSVIGCPFQKILIEEEPVEGYKTEIVYDLPDGTYPELGSRTLITNVRVITINGKKIWQDGDNQDGKRPESITVRLMNGDTEVASNEVTAADGWSWSFTDVPKYKNGNEINYTIKEDAVAEYTSTINGYDITNTYVPETIDISGQKTWNDNNNQDGKRPDSITVRLMNGDVEVASKEVTAADGWSWSFNDVPKYQNGSEINYTIKEDVVEEYTTEINGYDITNTYVPETITIHGQKTWDDNNNQDGKRPSSIIIRLMSGATELVSKEVTAADGWSWSFIDLAKYKDGKLIEYTLREDKVPNYLTTVDGYNLINTIMKPETITVEATKEWKGGPKADHIAVKLHLYRETQSTPKEFVNVNPIVSGKGPFHYTWQNLEKENAKGEEYIYSIEEDGVIDDKVVINSNAYLVSQKGNTITNTYLPEKTAIKVTKVWDDSDNKNGSRPDSIMVRLMADGVEVATKELQQSDGWKVEFADLVKEKDGKDIVYTVTEDKVDHYTTTISGNAKDGFIVTNKENKAALPATGYDNTLRLFTMLLGISLLLFGSIFIVNDNMAR